MSWRTNILNAHDSQGPSRVKSSKIFMPKASNCSPIASSTSDEAFVRES
jgi:hypothetical protein